MPSKNNKYKLLKRLKSLSSSINQYDDLWSQWILVDSMTTANDIDDECCNKLTDWCTHNFNKKNKCTSCLCSKHPITNLNLMINCYTNERCIIGCCCIKKFGSKKLVLDMKVNQGEKIGHRYCEICKRKLSSKYESWQIYHDNCYNKK